MKIWRKYLIWFICVIMSCCLTMLLYGLGAGTTAVPHANVQLLVPFGKTTAQVAAQAETAAKSLGYVKQPSDGLTKWTYKKGAFSIEYSLEDDTEYGKTVVWLHFYIWNTDYFDKSGIAEYQAFIGALRSQGLEPSLINDPRYPGRTIFTPAMFNAEYAPYPAITRAMPILFGLALLLPYGVIVLWPAPWIEIRVFNRFSISIVLKRILFVVINSLLFAPAPVPLPLLGPLPLVPAALMLPLALAYPDFIKVLVGSVVSTAVIASLLSVLIRNPLKNPPLVQ